MKHAISNKFYSRTNKTTQFFYLTENDYETNLVEKLEHMFYWHTSFVQFASSLSFGTRPFGGIRIYKKSHTVKESKVTGESTQKTAQLTLTTVNISVYFQSIKVLKKFILQHWLLSHNCLEVDLITAWSWCLAEVYR